MKIKIEKGLTNIKPFVIIKTEGNKKGNDKK